METLFQSFSFGIYLIFNLSWGGPQEVPRNHLQKPLPPSPAILLATPCGSWAARGGSWQLLGGSWQLLGGSWRLLVFQAYFSERCPFFLNQIPMAAGAILPHTDTRREACIGDQSSPRPQQLSSTLYTLTEQLRQPFSLSPIAIPI